MSSVRHLKKEDLETDEVNVSVAPLQAGAFHYQIYCKQLTEKFINCRYWKKDPRKCLDEGKELTDCGSRFFKQVKENCDESFVKFFECLDNNNMEYTYCKRQRIVFSKCMEDVVRIDYDYKSLP